MTERINSDATYFRIFADDIIFFDHRLHAIALGFFSCSVSGTSGQAGGPNHSAPARCQTLDHCTATA
jgi:hypothetical protein